MRIGELSRRSGVSVPTIKFYLREGLPVRCQKENSVAELGVRSAIKQLCGTR
jgi:DNA-binding transcriptional MerR regulator